MEYLVFFRDDVKFDVLVGVHCFHDVVDGFVGIKAKKSAVLGCCKYKYRDGG